MSKICLKKFYRVRFVLTSPLALSSGENNYADKDVLRDSLGRPYIPASSIAGVFQSVLRELSEPAVKDYFGYIVKATDDNNRESAAEESRLIFYDAVLLSDSETISVRDSVALDEYKTAIKGAKFDMEVVEPGIEFISYIEYTKYENDNLDENFVLKLLNILSSGQLAFGSKTTRGYGNVSVVSMEEKIFDLSSKRGQGEYVDFDMYDLTSLWNPINSIKAETIYHTLTIGLRLDGAISIRKYSSRPSTDENHPEPDYEQLTLHDNTPVIPGTSWSGAFRHRMSELGLSKNELDKLFGWVNKTTGAKSILRFSETQLEHSKEKRLSRNAIDRFSGGVVGTALFTERTWYGGDTELSITSSKHLSDKEINALSAAIADLHYGFLLVGGLSSIGRGKFIVTKINGTDLDNNDINSKVREVLQGWK